jgi:formamidopyrimidine-DNA glycosylase
MPELPDLQVISHNLDKRFSGKKLEKIEIREKKRLSTDARNFKRELEGRKLQKVYREGKELRFLFDSKDLLGVHLMLHGAFRAFGDRNENPHTIAELYFSGASGLALTDFQGLAVVSLNPQPADAPDALSKHISPAFLEEKLSSTRAAVKNVLTNQHVIRGIGNAYADEILWEAGISPFSAAKSIPREKLKDLAASIKQVLARAEKQIRASHPDIISGEVRDFLLIHNPHKTKSPSGAPIETKKAGGGKTYYTLEQQLFR